MYIEPRIVKKYGRVRRLAEHTTEAGERQAAEAARHTFEEKYPGISEAYHVHLEQEKLADEAVAMGYADPNIHQDQWGWERFAEMAGDFFSRAKEYTEFAFGIGYARKLAQKALFRCRDNVSGSMSVNFRIQADDLDTLSLMTHEQKLAFIAAVSDEFEEVLGEYIATNL